MDIGLFEKLGAPATSFILSLLTYAILAVFQARPKIIWSKAHQFCYNIKGDQQGLVYTETYLFQNNGRKVAEDIEIVLSYKPANYAIWPTRDYSEAANPEGHFVVKVPNLAPREHFTLNMLQMAQPPLVTTVRTPSRIGKAVDLVPSIKHSKYFNISILLLIFLGILYIFNISISVFIYLLR